MITGTVNARYEAVLPLPIRDSQGNDHQIEPVIDTGFNGSLTLPASVIASLGLTWRSRTTALLANGIVQHIENYLATVIWDGSPKSILVQELENIPLIGMRLLVDHDVRLRVQVGGAVEIEAVP